MAACVLSERTEISAGTAMTVEDVTATLSQQGIVVGKGRRVRFDRSEAREFMRRWTERGQGVLRAVWTWERYGRAGWRGGG